MRTKVRGLQTGIRMSREGGGLKTTREGFWGLKGELNGGRVKTSRERGGGSGGDKTNVEGRKTNCVQTDTTIDRQTDRVSSKRASLLKRFIIWGSGKSLALLCASLSWQEAETEKVREFNALLEQATNTQVKYLSFFSFKWNESLFIYPRSTHWLTVSLTHSSVRIMLLCPIWSLSPVSRFILSTNIYNTGEITCIIFTYLHLRVRPIYTQY